MTWWSMLRQQVTRDGAGPSTVKTVRLPGPALGSAGRGEEGLNGGPDAGKQAMEAATHALRPTTQTTGHGGVVAPFLHEQIQPTTIGTRQAMPDASDAADRRPLLRVGC